jgi:hypothetical protein
MTDIPSSTTFFVSSIDDSHTPLSRKSYTLYIELTAAHNSFFNLVANNRHMLRLILQSTQLSRITTRATEEQRVADHKARENQAQFDHMDLIKINNHNYSQR